MQLGTNKVTSMSQTVFVILAPIFVFFKYVFRVVRMGIQHTPNINLCSKGLRKIKTMNA